jgi:catechol-2,3-dioxygenase
MVANFYVLADEPVRPRKLAHVVLRTYQLKEMAAFYKTFLGGHASHENEFVSFIAYDDEHHRIAIAQIPGLGPKNKQTCGLEVSS